MSRIDYSKWDNLDEYSSDEEDTNDDDHVVSNINNKNKNKNNVHVTKLDAPSRVVFGGGNNNKPKSEESSSVYIYPESSSSLSSSLPTATAAAAATTTATTNKKQQQQQLQVEETSWIDRGGSLENFTTTTESKTNNQTSSTTTTTTICKNKLYWSQDRYSVCFRLKIPNNQEEEENNNNNNKNNNNIIISGKDIHVHVDGMLPYSERNCAIIQSKIKMPKLIITANNKFKKSTTIVLLEAILPHPVHIPEDDDSIINTTNTNNTNNNTIELSDWTIERDSYNQQYIMIQLYKAVPMEGITIWWDCPFLGSTSKIDLSTIRNTTTNTNNNNPTKKSSSTTTTTTQFAKAWDEAHRIFRENRQKEKTEQKNKTKINI